MTDSPKTERQIRQDQLDARVAELRGQAAELEKKAEAINSTINHDYAFWTQPAYNNAAGRAFSRQRDRMREKRRKAVEIHAEALALRRKADGMEARGVTMAGDAAAERQAFIDALKVEVGQIIDTMHFGVCRVLKVNRLTVLVEGPRGPYKISKEFIKPPAQDQSLALG